MTKADTPSSTTAPPGARALCDADLIEWDRQRQFWSDAAEAVVDDEDEVARCSDRADEFEDLIRAAPCTTKTAALLKLEAIHRVQIADRFNAPVTAEAVLAQVLHFVDGAL